MVRSVLLTAALVLLVVPSHAEDEPARDKEMQKAFSWFDTLGYPQIGRLPFVRVQTGGWSKSGDEDPVADFEYAFLLDDVGREFRVFGIDLSTSTYVHESGPDVEPWRRSGYDVLAIDRALRAGLERSDGAIEAHIRLLRER